MANESMHEYRAKQSEKEFQESIISQAKALGWRCYHTFDSRRSEPGFPDLVCVHPGLERTFYAELKRENGRLSNVQEFWISALSRAGMRVYVWRPSDGDEIERVLRGEKS